MAKLFHNWHLKILSLLSAVLLWFFVVGIENTVYVFPEGISVQAVNVGKNVSLAEELPAVKLYLRVEGNIVKNLNKSDFEVTVDLSDLSTGEYQLPVKAASKNPQVTVLKTEPEKVNLKLSPLAEKEVTVATEFRGTPKAGYSVKEITPEMDTVKVAAAQNVLDKIQNVTAVLLFDGSESGQMTRNVVLEIPEIAGVPAEGIKIIPEEILLTANIVPELKQKVVGITPVITGATDAESLLKQLITVPSTVAIRGEEQYLQPLTSLQTKPVDAAYLLNRTAPAEVSLVLPENVSLVDPAQKITIQLNTPAEQKSVFAPVIFTRENPSFTVKKVTPSQIKVTLTGPSSLIKNLKTGDITVNVNLQDVSGAGILLINVTDIIVPPGLAVASFEPDQVELETT